MYIDILISFRLDCKMQHQCQYHINTIPLCIVKWITMCRMTHISTPQAKVVLPDHLLDYLRGLDIPQLTQEDMARL